MDKRPRGRPPLDDPRERLSATIDAAQMRQIETIARSYHGNNSSEAVRDILRRGLAAYWRARRAKEG